MSRVKTILIAAILVVGILFPTTAMASPGATVSITDATLPAGASGSVVLSISTTEPVSCIDVDITYNPDVVKVTDVSGSDFDRLMSNIQDNHTHLGAWVASPTGLTGTIKVADITLTRIDGETELALNVITLKGDTNNPIPFTVDNGRVTGVTDDTPPSVTSTSPASGATGVAITATVRATFSEVIDSGTLAFSVGGVSGTTTYTGTTATFTPGANLAYSRTYTASVSASDLAGNAMAAYSWSFTTRAAPPVVGGGGEGEYEPPAPPPGTTDVRGKVSTAGVFLRSVTATSEDELCELSIPRDTVGLTEELEPLDEITILEMDEPPPPPEDAHVIGLAYDFGPDGATFEPAITLTWSYDPADIPEGVAEEDLVIAYYDEEAGEWVELEGCVVDTENKTITAPVEHFTTFAIVVAIPPPPPPAPAVFSVKNLSVKPLEVQPKEAVTITLWVANTGGTEGSYTVVLKINGVKEAEKRTTVAAGRSQTVSFTVSREDAGTYSLVVDGLSGSFTVIKPVPAVAPPPVPVPAPVPPPPPSAPPPAPLPEVIPPTAPNWPLIGGIIGGTIIVGLLIFFLIRRRAY